MLPPHLQIEPIRRNAAAPPRRSALLVSALAHLGLAWWCIWFFRQRLDPPAPLAPKATFNVELVEDPSPEAAGGPKGTGARDPAQVPAPAVSRPDDLMATPAQMPQAPERSAMDLSLPVAPGGDGKPAGPGGEGEGMEGFGIKGMGPGGLRVRLGDMDILRREEPVYPPSEMSNGIEDTVELEITIDEHGVPVVVKVRRSEVPTLAAEAVRAIRNWRFAPIRHQGVPVRATFRMDVQFMIANKAVKPRKAGG